MSDAEDRKEARAVLKRLKDIPKNKLTVTQQANKTEAMGILSGRDTEQETYRPTTRNKKEGGKVMAKKYPVKKKRHGGMTHVGLSPAEEARAGTMSEAGRAKYMAEGGKLKKKRSLQGGYLKDVPKMTYGAFKKKYPDVKITKKGYADLEQKALKKALQIKPLERTYQGVSSTRGAAKKGGPVHTTFPKRAAPRTEGRETAIDLFPKVERAKAGKVGNKKSRGKRISNKETDGSKLVAFLYD